MYMVPRISEEFHKNVSLLLIILSDSCTNDCMDIFTPITYKRLTAVFYA